MTAQPLRVLDGRYRLQDRLGQGAMGSVWKAYDTRLERTVAVKELASGRDGGEDLDVQRERVRREALALAKVEHPVIVSIHDLLYEGPGQDPWIVMAYVRGRSLDRIIRDSPPLGERRVASIGLAVLDGLMACHRRNVYHRDVKPANIVLSDDGAVRLVDFGIARIVGENSLTAESKVLGTPEFLAPELFTDRPAGPLTDLWALGVTLYCALEGRPPFRGETLPATIAAILGREPEEPRNGGEVAALILAMLRKHPAERADAGTVEAVLRRTATCSPRRSGPTWKPGLPSRPDPPSRPAMRQVRQDLRITPLSGMPAADAARIVTDWPADRAVTDLLALDENAAARIISRCADPVAGRLLSGIAAGRPGRVRKVLEMLTTERAGRLVDHMSSQAAASALSLPTPTGAVRVLAMSDDLTVAGVLSEMRPERAAGLVMAMAADRAARLLGRAAPAEIAGILDSVHPQARRAELLARLPEPLRTLVTRHR